MNYSTTVEVRIPYKIGQALGDNYNELMSLSKDWVCFIDHDILICNPNWYEMILTAISRYGKKLGFLTGTTNRIACGFQLQTSAPNSNDIQAHWNYANYLYQTHSDECVQVELENGAAPFSGFFLLTHKGAWREVGGFKPGFLGVDNDYHKKILLAGYKSYVMPALYCYHIYRNKKVWGFYGVDK